ncbi:MAG TPA: hypothetical protein VEV61_04285 [Streptosporangiaceae bacterium]|nr:hypothetical protein [Streptosporangiaceae bacterium]
MASYEGSPFEAGIGPADGDIVLFAACPPPEELGFEPATGHWRKQLSIHDVQAVWESRPVGMFRGERCMVLDDLGDRLHIGYLGHDGYKAERLGYWQVDRGVFELIAPRGDVTEIVEERIEHRSQTSRAATRPTAAMPARARPSTAMPAAAMPATGTPMRSGQSRPPTAAQPASAPPTAADELTGVAIPEAADAPLPLEAQALRAASAARRSAHPTSQTPTSQTLGLDALGLPIASPPAAAARTRHSASALGEHGLAETGLAESGLAEPVLAESGLAESGLAESGLAESGPARPRRAARRRLATEHLFAELASQAGIPARTYAIGEEIEGALCMLQTERGFEVFHCSGGARHEQQRFATEEAACFYLFGVLAAEAVRSGSLMRGPAAQAARLI